MDPKDFIGGPGRIITTPEGHSAFVPDPLPPAMLLGSLPVKLVEEASRALGELVGVGRRLPNPHMLIRPFLRQEAILSSRIEGTHTTPKELLLFEISPNVSPSTPDVREVSNYVKALEYGLAGLNELPVCLRLIRELHAKLLKGVRGADRRPGEFRSIQNYISQPGRQIQDARFVPPPPQEMKRALEDLEIYIHTADDLPSLVRIALVHYQFEAIHPFADGNGRIGRLLISLLLCESGLLLKPLLYLSAYFERNRTAYYDHLLRVSQAGAWNEWIEFFLLGVTEQAREATNRCLALLDLWQEYRNKMQEARSSALLLRLVDALFARPALTIPLAKKLLRVTYPSAQRNVYRLERAGILVEVTHRKRNRLYLAPKIMSILSPSDTSPA
jgi:Fic family protein